MSSQKKLELKKPLVFFDLETTGTNITNDRIVELSYIKVYPDGLETKGRYLINPERHIPDETTKIHHISDEDVKNEPNFKKLSDEIYEIFNDSDIAGFNSNRFDIPFLIEEFARAGKIFQIHGRKFIDVQNIFHKMEQRTLSAAYKFYCGKELLEAHTAEGDTRATYEVLVQQINRYPELGNDVESLSAFSGLGKQMDLAGRIILNEKDEPIFNFGKHKGKRVNDVFRTEPSFYQWMMQGDFPKNTKDVLAQLKSSFDEKYRKRNY